MKQTEIGLIPDDWEVKRLGEVCDVRDGTHESPSYYDFGYPFITSKNLINGVIDFTDIQYISKNDYDKINERSKVDKNDILFSMIGTIGKSVLVLQEPNFAIKNVALFKNTNKCNQVYLKQYLDSDICFSRMNEDAKGSTQTFIPLGYFRTFLVPFPPLAEQKRIAKALSDVDALISTTEKLVQKKKNIKQGTMQNLLTGKKRLPAFAKSTNYKQSELGLIPEDWEVKPLGELINDICDGPFGSNLKTEHYTNEKEARIIQLSNVSEDGWDDENVKYTTFIHAKEIQRCIVPYGSIVIAKMMPAGRAIICPSQEKMYVLGSDCVRITPNYLLNSLFFMYFTKTSFYLTQIKENTQGSTRARTSVSKLRKIEIAFPSKEEQTAIANVLSSMDKEIESLNAKLEKYRNLKTAMMQQLLTGKIRL